MNVSHIKTYEAVCAVNAGRGHEWYAVAVRALKKRCGLSDEDAVIGYARRAADWSVKICSVCKCEKPRTGFGVSAKRPGGISDQCLECSREIDRERRALKSAGTWPPPKPTVGPEPCGGCAFAARCAKTGETCERFNGWVETGTVDMRHERRPEQKCA